MSTAIDAPRTPPAVVPYHLASPRVRSAFGLAERVAPAIGALAAERIWFTLPPRRGSRAPALTTGPGTPFVVSADGHDVVGEAWGDGPTIYLVHGWAGSREQLAAFVAPLVDSGFRVVAHDAPSHGGSPAGAFGKRSSTLPEFVSALSAVAAAHGPAHTVIAHSMGATAAANALGGLYADRLVMLAPMASLTSYARRFVTGLGGGDRIHERLLARINRRIEAPLGQFEVAELGEGRRMPATLIVHDSQDPSVPLAEAAAVASSWRDATLRVTSGLGHYRLLRDPRVVADVVDFVTS